MYAALAESSAAFSEERGAGVSFFADETFFVVVVVVVVEVVVDGAAVVAVAALAISVDNGVMVPMKSVAAVKVAPITFFASSKISSFFCRFITTCCDDDFCLQTLGVVEKALVLPTRAARASNVSLIDV